MNASAAGSDPATLIDLTARRSPEAVSAVSACVRRDGAWTIVEVDGEMDLPVVTLLSEALGSGSRRVVFDLRAVTFMDASGLGLLLGQRREALAAGGTVRVVGPSRSARRLLTLAGCARAFRTFDSVEEAVSAPVSGHRVLV